MPSVLGAALLALTLLGLTGCRWSQALRLYTEILIYNHTSEWESGDPASTLCTQGLGIILFDYYETAIQFALTIAPGDSKIISSPEVSPTTIRYKNPHYRIEVFCFTDSQAGKSVREVQGERLIFEIRPPNFKTGENPDEVSPPGPWIIKKGPLF